MFRFPGQLAGSLAQSLVGLLAGRSAGWGWPPGSLARQLAGSRPGWLLRLLGWVAACLPACFPANMVAWPPSRLRLWTQNRCSTSRRGPPGRVGTSKIGPKSDRKTECRPKTSHERPVSSEFPADRASCRPRRSPVLDFVSRASAEIGLTSGESRRMRPIWSDLSQSKASSSSTNFDRDWPDFGRHRPGFGRIWMMSNRVGLNWTNPGLQFDKLYGRYLSNVAHCRVNKPALKLVVCRLV